jgi:sugar phosphate isomerase/epimerase
MKIEQRFGYSIYDDPVEDCIEFALQHHLSHFELDMTPRHSQLNTFDKNRIDNLVNLAVRHNFTYSLHPPSATNIGHSIQYFRNKHVRYLDTCILLGKALGVTHITLHLGTFAGHTSMHFYRQAALTRIVDSLRTLNVSLSKYEIVLALENSVKLHNGSDIELLGDNINDFSFIFSEIDSPYIKLCFDTGHANINEGTPDYIHRFHDKIHCIHFHDNNRLSDEHLQPGSGTVDWEDTVRALKKINYNGLFISECFKIKPHHARDLFLDYWEKEYIR